jgi:hypothetical protein
MRKSSRGKGARFLSQRRTSLATLWIKRSKSTPEHSSMAIAAPSSAREPIRICQPPKPIAVALEPTASHKSNTGSKG